MPELRKGHELFLGLVGAVGTDLELVVRALTKSLKSVEYSTARIQNLSNEDHVSCDTSIRLAKLLRNFEKYKNLPISPVDVYVDAHMSAGDEFRSITEQFDALAIMAIIEIMAERKDAEETGLLHEKIIPNRAYILRSLKHPDELETLRGVYGENFLLIAAYSPHDARRDNLARRISESRTDPHPDKYQDKAETLIKRDQEEIGLPHGQNVSAIFHKADVFVDTTNVDDLGASIDRFVELIFGNTFHSPTRREYGMFHARAAALRSAEPGRQVGAAIATKEGDIVAVGVNEVPKAFGGMYWYEDHPDGREFKIAQQSGQEYIESNQRHIRNVLADTLNYLLKYLKSAELLNPVKQPVDVDRLVDLAFEPSNPLFPKSSQIRHLIEFGRAAHAEMAALTDAARRGVSVAGCTMFVTTFPCHLCARLIVAAGISKVIYVEPYAKSLTADLYPDSIAIEQDCNDKVQFEPFVGVAPRQYMKLFSKLTRMSKKGKILPFNPNRARLRYYGNPRVYLENEDESAAILKRALVKKGLLEVT